MPVNLPNQITLIRLVLAIVFFVLLGRHSQRDPQPVLLYISFVVFVVAALTDILDGYLARRHNQVTALGRVLDPFVDKVLVCGAFVFLAGPGFTDPTGRNVTELQSWMVVVILGRELLVTGLRGFSESRGVAFGAETIGKAKMWIQSITVGVILVVNASHVESPNRGLEWLQFGAVWLTVIITLASLVTYVVKSKSILLETTRR